MIRDTSSRITGRRLQRRRLTAWAENPCCASCGALTEWPNGFQLDHIEPLFKGGADTLHNCQVLCLACHEVKTCADVGATYRQPIGADGWPDGRDNAGGGN